MRINRGNKRNRFKRNFGNINRCSSATTSKNMLLRRKKTATAASDDCSVANFTLCLHPGLHIQDLCQDDLAASKQWTNK